MTRCQSSATCNYWTWIKPTYDGQQFEPKKCYLMSVNEVSSKVALQGVISGTKICNTGKNISLVGSIKNYVSSSESVIQQQT